MRAEGPLRRWSALEAGRFVLWVPVLLGVGILLWTAGPLDQPAGLIALVGLLFAVLWRLAYRREAAWAFHVARAATVLLLGALIIEVRTDIVRTPLVPSGMPATELVGTLERVEQRQDDLRYTLRVETLGNLPTDDLPRRVRIVWRGEAGSAQAGDRVRTRVQVSPPPGPALPGGYDFSRQMIYQGIGGSGFAYQPMQVLDSGGAGFSLRVEALREDVADRIETIVGGAEGAVAAALVTGKRERIPDRVVDALRDAGLAHLLAISGLHMGLVCGFLFWTARMLLTRSAYLTLTMPVKKWAAFAALVGGAGYLLLSGGAWSALRAYIMAAVVFGAILFDRQGISLRNVAIAATIILVFRPEALLSPGFQMSFAAVVTLIAAFEVIEQRFPRSKDYSVLGHVTRFVSGLTMTSVLAGMATGPFAMFHFGRLATFGLLGNLLAVPLVTLAVMPALVLAMFLMPFGLDGPILVLVGYGLRLVIAIAQWTSGLPYAVQLIPQVAPAGILCASAGLILLALLRAPWRLSGGFLCLVAPLLSLQTTQPSVFLSRDLRNVGVVQEGGASLAVLSQRRDRFSVEAWQQALGMAQDSTATTLRADCDDRPCALLPGGIVLIPDRTDLTVACTEATIVVMRARAVAGDRERCAVRLIHLDADGRHPPASLTMTREGWELQLALGAAKAL